MGVTIHTVEVSTDDIQLVDDASEWLRTRLGEPTWADVPQVDGKVRPHDPTLLYTSKRLWDGYVNPADFRAFFRIKGHDDLALLFKLTFGGK